MRRFVVLLLLASCGIRTSPHVAELPPTKQKQKIAFLQKKLQLAEKEQRKLKAQVERLSDEMREAELAYIRKQIDDYEALIRKQPSKKADYDSADLFLSERERLHQMIQTSESSYEAQVVLDRILQLITELSDEPVRNMELKI
jgi:septal ring factor EnvC (AmiA/AmiB activator)